MASPRSIDAQPGMHLKSLKTYCDVVRLGSFSKAAEANNVSQSNVSQLVHHLEDHLGVRLIDTSKRPFVVTPEGQRYHEGCKEVVRRYEEVERQVQSLKAASGESVHVAAIYSVGLGEMHSLAGKYRELYPEVELRVEYMHPDKVEHALLKGEADLGITSFAAGLKGLKVWPWRDEPFAVAASPQHPLAQMPSVTPEQLRGHHFVMPQDGLRVRREIDRWLVAQQVEVRVELEFDNLESVKRAIEVNEGIGLLPAPTFATEAGNGSLVHIDIDSNGQENGKLMRPMGIVARKEQALSDMSQRFLDLLLKHKDSFGAPALNGSAMSVATQDNK